VSSERLIVRAESSLPDELMVSRAHLERRTWLIDIANDPVLLGPDSVGQFIPSAIKTIQRKRAPVMSAEAGQSVS
jgi:hypothetical protein